MKAGWEVRPLGEVAQLLNGRAYKKAELLEEGPHKVLRVGNLFTSHKWYYSDIDLPASKTIDTGDLLYAWSASFGPFRWEGGPAIYHYHIWKVLPDERRVTRDFLHYYFEWDKEKIQEEQGAGATMLHVSKKSMEARAAPLPPLEEQRRIVAVLDEAFEGLARVRANIEANLADAEELSGRTRDEAFAEDARHAEVRQLGDYIARITYGFTNPMPTSDAGPWKVTAKDVVGGRINYRTARHTTEEAFENLLTNKSRPSMGDVLITKDGTLGRTAVVDRPGICINQSVAVLTPTDEVSPDYLSELLITSKVHTALVADAGGTTVKHLYITRIPSVPVSIPDHDAQMRTLVRWRQARNEIGTLTGGLSTQLADLATLRQSLLARAFRGELT